MSEVDFKELRYGFKFGDAVVERWIADAKKGWVVVNIKSSKQDIEVYVTKTGKIRIHDKKGNEFLLPKK